MALYVWAQYYYGPPVTKTIKSYEIQFAEKHVHGLQPSAKDVAAVSEDLHAKVEAAGNAAQQQPPVPANYAPDIKTRSAH
jgi:hypothetical protein